MCGAVCACVVCLREREGECVCMCMHECICTCWRGGLVFAWGGGGVQGCMWWVGACTHVCVACVCNLPLETPFLNL